MKMEKYPTVTILNRMLQVMCLSIGSIKYEYLYGSNECDKLATIP